MDTALLPLRADSRLPLDRPFTPAQAAAAGVTRDVLRRLLREGLVRRLLKGVYVDVAADDDLLLRARALALVVPPSAVVTDRTAGWLHGAEVLAPGDHVVLPPVEVFQQPGRTRVRTRGNSGGERTLAPRDVTSVHGVRVTTALRTALDLGRLLPREHAIAALDSLLRLGHFGRDELLGSVERFRRQRGVVQLRSLAPLADARAESPPESVLRLRWHDAGLPVVPVPQVAVAGPGLLGYRVDLGVEELRLAVEYDGRDWHTTAAQRAHDERRRRWLREQGWTVLVLTKADVFGPDPDRAVRLIRAAVDRALRAGMRRPVTSAATRR